jgi:hypothetical protein
MLDRDDGSRLIVRDELKPRVAVRFRVKSVGGHHKAHQTDIQSGAGS